LWSAAEQTQVSRNLTFLQRRVKDMMVLEIASLGMLEILFSLILQLVYGSVQNILMDVSSHFLKNVLPEAMTL
jgi:hypothetical protein